MVIVALVKRIKPNVCADEKNGDAIDEEQPVEQDEWSFTPYSDENEGADEGCQEDYPQNGSACKER